MVRAARTRRDRRIKLLCEAAGPSCTVRRPPCLRRDAAHGRIVGEWLVGFSRAGAALASISFAECRTAASPCGYSGRCSVSSAGGSHGCVPNLLVATGPADTDSIVLVSIDPYMSARRVWLSGEDVLRIGRQTYAHMGRQAVSESAPAGRWAGPVGRLGDWSSFERIVCRPALSAAEIVVTRRP